MALEVAKNSWGFYGTTLKADVAARTRANAKAPAVQRDEAVRSSSHNIFKTDRGVFKCKVCLKTSSKAGLEEFGNCLRFANPHQPILKQPL